MEGLSAQEKALLVNAVFQPIYSTKGFPPAVAADMGLSKHDRVMADPGKSWSVGCIGPRDIPHQRLVFGGRSTDRCLIFFERGGVAHFYCARLYELSGDKATLLAQSYAKKAFADIDELKKAVKDNQLF